MLAGKERFQYPQEISVERQYIDDWHIPLHRVGFVTLGNILKLPFLYLW